MAATTNILHWLQDVYITRASWDKSIHNITNYGSSWLEGGSTFYNQSSNDVLHNEHSLPITSAAHLGLVTGLVLAVLVNSRLSNSKVIDWQYWLETMGMNIMFTVLCLLFTVAMLPFLAVFLAILACYRKAIELYLKNTHPQFVSLLEGLDAIWAVEEDTSFSVINVLAIVEVEDIFTGNELLESFRRAIVSSFGTPPFPCPKLFYFRRKCLGYFYWEHQQQLRIAHHVRWMKQVDGDGVTEDTLKGIIAEVSNCKLPADHAACWEILVGRQHLVKQKAFQTSDVFQAMEEGFPDASSSSILRYPVLFRIHHSLGDGVALMKLLLSGLADKVHITEDLRSRTPSPIPAFLTTSDFASGTSSPTEDQPQRNKLPKSEIVIELENLSDEQDKISRSCSPVCARPTSPYLTPCQSPLPLDQYSRSNTPSYVGSRCLSPEEAHKRSTSPLLLTTRSHSPIIGKAIVRSPRCMSPFLESRSATPLLRSQSMSMSAVRREDSPLMRNATSVQCYQQNACNCFASSPQTREHVIPGQGANFTTIYYYNPSGANGNLNPQKRRGMMFERASVFTAPETNSCTTKPHTSFGAENSARNVFFNNKTHSELQASSSVNVTSEANQFPAEGRRNLAEKEVHRMAHAGSNTEAIKCTSTSTQTSPLKSVNATTQNNPKRHFRQTGAINRKHSTSSATIDADHSNTYVQKAATNTAATTQISMEAYEDNVSTFSVIKVLSEVWNDFTNQKNEQKIYNCNAYTPPSTPNPYIQLLNSISTTTNKPKSAVSFAQTACALIFAPATLINQTLMKVADRNSLHGPALSGHKVVAWHVDYSGELLQNVKRVKDRCGTHFTDVVLAGLSASLDSYFSTHPDSCGSVPQSVTVVVPARMEAPEPVRFTHKYDLDSDWGTVQLSTEDARNTIAVNNRFSVAMLTLPLNGQQDRVLKPRERLRQVYHHSKQLRNSPDYLVNYWLLRFVATLLPTPLLSAVVHSSHSTLVVSNMVGPARRLSMAGSQLRDLIFWVPHRGATGIGVTVLSYMDRLQFGIMADRALVTCQQDAQLILNAAISEIRHLEQISE